MIFNLNSKITVTLTQEGFDFIAKNGYIEKYGHGLIEIDGNKCTGDGWRIMNIFAPLFTGIASDTPFDMNIEVKPTCKSCGGNCKPGKALKNETLYGEPDIVGKRTVYEGEGEAKIKDVLKCQDCGHSFIPKQKTLPKGRVKNVN